MRPVETDETNFTFKLPGGTSENDLPCRVEGDTVASVWEIEDGDLDNLGDQPKIVLRVDWSELLDVSIQVSDGVIRLSPATSYPVDGPPKAFVYTVDLSMQEELQLRGGAYVTLKVGMRPPPPVSLWLA